MANKLLKILMWIISIVAAIAVGGLFLDGTTLANPILKYIGIQLIHTVIGWIIIGGTLLGAVLDIASK